MTDAPSQADAVPVVLIDVFKCEKDQQSALFDHLLVLVRAQSGLPGFLSAALHRGLNGRIVANHAVWRSVEDWKAMTRDHRVSAAMRPILALATFEPNLYAPGETIG